MKFTVRRTAGALLLASSALTALPAFGQEAAEVDANEIVVTAQKRSENLQNVPISIQALGTAKLEQLNISDFKGYAQQLPSVSFQSGGTPGTNVVYMRGVASGGDGNHSGSLPSVGVYLDEQPVTTIGGNLDVHIYDVARIESLSGPQGTLYGASSQAGTIRIITNKPSTAGYEGSIDGEVNAVKNGGIGGKLDGMVNAPINDSMALRVVAFYQRDAGYIDNVAGRRCFLPQPGGFCVTNTAYVEENYNETETYGARAALKVDLDDNWTVTPSVTYQKMQSQGSYAFDPKVGDLQLQRFAPEFRNDKWVQAALTIEGKVGNWDVTYAGAYLDRKTLSSSDYTDYSEAYDSLYASVGGLAGYFYFLDSAGKGIDPRQKVIGTDHFKKLSQELRIASPADQPLRFVGGVFYQRQSNDIFQDYQVANLGPQVSVNGSPGTLWLTKQERIDRDYAAFGELSYDLLENVTLTAGARAYKFDNTLIGFFGFGRNPGGNFSDSPYNGAGSSRTGVAGCFTTTGARLRPLAGTPGVKLLPGAVDGTPCTNLGVWNGTGVDPVRVKDDGFTWRFNLSWKATSDLMVYTTASKGFRPGGVNRRADVAPYDADFLVNYEIGWKSTLAQGLRFNGAVYQQNWNDFQYSFLGANSFTEIHNGPDARIRGIDVDMTYNGGGLYLQVAGAYTDAKTTKNLCSVDDSTFACVGLDDDDRPNLISAAKGTALPITPKWKLSATARYTADMGNSKPYGQINVAHQSSASGDIRTKIYETFSDDLINPAALLGRLPAFTTVNLAFGVNWGSYNVELYASNLLDERGQSSRFVQCGSCYQRPYVVPITPRTIGLRAGTKF
jgi:outer membrane receptor protein involved in Fe transport